jgi:hypothetical protein
MIFNCCDYASHKAYYTPTSYFAYPDPHQLERLRRTGQVAFARALEITFSQPQEIKYQYPH